MALEILLLFLLLFRYVIYVKPGIYEENVVVTKQMVNVTIYGDGSQKSIITGNKNFVDGVPTFQTATFGKSIYRIGVTYV